MFFWSGIRWASARLRPAGIETGRSFRQDGPAGPRIECYDRIVPPQGTHAFPNLVIDSISPESYRSNDGTPMAGYKALFGALDHFQRHANPALNVPTLVMMDREDEFISHDAMRKMIGRPASRPLENGDSLQDAGLN